jgi:hypothetical protein
MMLLYYRTRLFLVELHFGAAGDIGRADIADVELNSVQIFSHSSSIVA